ncbi:9338_t:CDS:10 [Diversispora eburnea]|uniref:Chloride channel protein n=1 Tax=Diversispora eburnea TaxID=1213867 RepID=A0A9N9BJ93_9GLOM|nr:9338_t:CDS:10 [Diversispora eburnea]
MDDDIILDDSIKSNTPTTFTTSTASNSSLLNREEEDEELNEYVTRGSSSTDELQKKALGFEINEGDMPDFDQMTLSAAEALNSNRIFSRSDSHLNKRSTLEIGHISTSLRKHNDEEFDGDMSDWSIEGTGRRVAYDDFTTIERARQQRTKQQKGFKGRLKIIFDGMEGWIVVLLVGIASGIIAGIIDITSDWLSDLKEGYCHTAFYLSRKNCCWDHNQCTEWITWNDALETKSTGAKFWTNYFFYIIFSTLFATAAAYLVKNYSPYSAGSGIPECLIVASSLSLGKEGPLVHLACCFGNIIPRIFPKFRYNEAKKREVLSAAAAAGVSVAFGSPIGGVLYSLEEASYYFPLRTMWRSFFCAMVAAVSLAGLYGALFIRINLKIATIRQESWLRFFSVHEVVFVTLCASIVSYLNIFMRVNPSELVANLFQECLGGDYHNLCKYESHWKPALLLLIASILKFFITAVTFGLKVPAGVWLPSMAIGACFGRAIGLLVYALHSVAPDLWIFSSCEPDVQCITPGMYAMVGAAATFGGVTLSLVVIMFELTGALTYVLPIMVAVMISKWVGDAFDREGIYDGWIRICEYPFLDSKEEYVYNTSASQVMTRVEDLLVITTTGHTLESLEELLNETEYKGFPVVHNSRNMLLIGYISRSELRYAMEKVKRKQGISSSAPCYFSSNIPILDSTIFVDFRPWMDQTPITISHKFPMEMVIEIFRKMGLRYVLVTKNGQLLGLITKKSVLRHLAAIHHPVNSDDFNENLMMLPERRMSSFAGENFGTD